MSKTHAGSLILGLVISMTVTGVASVLPHPSYSVDACRDTCWVCQAKAVGVAAPILSAGINPQIVLTAFLPKGKTVFFAWAVPLVQVARAPPPVSL